MNDIRFFDFLFGVLVANFSRYIIISGTFFVLFYLVFKKRWAGKKSSLYSLKTRITLERFVTQFIPCLFLLVFQ